MASRGISPSNVEASIALKSSTSRIPVFAVFIKKSSRDLERNRLRTQRKRAFVHFFSAPASDVPDDRGHSTRVEVAVDYLH
jgi:hypothetical protein